MAVTYIEIKIRSNEETKKNVKEALEAMELTPTQALTALLDYLVEHRKLPLGLVVPEVKKATAAITLVTLSSIDEVMGYLHAQD